MKKAQRWILLLFPSLLMAQSPQETPTQEQGLIIHASAIGALKYPGLQIGTDYLYKDNLVEKEKRHNRIKSFHAKRFITANIGFYHHKYYNTNIYLLAGHQWRRERSSGWYTLVEPQIGVSRTFLEGTTYVVSNDGQVDIKKAAGHFYLASAVTFGIGKDLKNKGVPLSLFIKTSLFTNMPYNNFVYARLTASLGVSYELDNLLTHKVKYKHIKKLKN